MINAGIVAVTFKINLNKMLSFDMNNKIKTQYIHKNCTKQFCKTTYYKYQYQNYKIYFKIRPTKKDRSTKTLLGTRCVHMSSFLYVP